MNSNFKIQEALHLQPFDESYDHRDARPFHVAAIGVGLIIGSLLNLACLGFVAAGIFGIAVKTYALALVVSVITAGLEWYAGLKGKALNHLFSMVLCTVALAISFMLAQAFYKGG